jgi:hypothetical protein
MHGRAVKFQKRSDDGSAKCNLVESEATTISYGVLYEFSSEHKAELDAAEGLGKGYREALLSFEFQGVLYQPFIYVASSTHLDQSLPPYDWYKAFVLSGARYHSLPDQYIAELESAASMPDPNRKRARDREALLAEMALFPQARHD